MIQCITSNLKKQCQVHHDSYELGSIPLQEYPNQPPIYDAPSIYDTDDYGDEQNMLAELMRDYPEDIPDEPLDMDLNDLQDMINVMDIMEEEKDTPVISPPAPVAPAMANLTPEDPTQRSYLDAFYDDEYDASDNTDNSGFFSEPNFKHGIMTPDIWDMFKSDWGQKVQ